MKSIKMRITKEDADKLPNAIQVNEALCFIDDALAFLSKKMHLTGIKIDKHYMANMDANGLAPAGDYIVPFSIKHNKMYKQATLHVYPACVDAYFGHDGRGGLFNGLVHEMCHLMSTELREAASNRYATKDLIKGSEEELVESIASLVRPYYIEEFNKLSKKVCEVKKQPSKKEQKQTNKLRAKLAS